MQRFLIIFILHCFSILLIKAQSDIKVYHSFDQIQDFLEPEGDTTLFINFWASWCKPCIEEMPAIEKVRKEFSEYKIIFLLVCLDDPSKLDNMVKPLLEKLGVHSRVILLDDTDYNSWIDKIDPSWSGAIPGSLMINKNVKNFYEKSFTYDQLKNLISNHLIQ